MTLDEFVAAIADADQVLVSDWPAVMGEVVYPDTPKEMARAFVCLQRKYLALKKTTKLWKKDPEGERPPALMPIADYEEQWEKATFASDSLARVKDAAAARGIEVEHMRNGQWRTI